MSFKEGEIVVNQKAPGWGRGKILEVVGERYRIFFEDGGEKLVGSVAMLKKCQVGNGSNILKSDYRKLKIDELLPEKETRWLIEQLEKHIILNGIRKGRGNFADASGSTHSPELYCFKTNEATLYIGFVKIPKYCSLYTGRFENPRHTYEMALHYQQSNKNNFRLFFIGNKQVALRCFGRFTVHQGIVYQQFFAFLKDHYTNLVIEELDNPKLKTSCYIPIFTFDLDRIETQINSFIESMSRLEKIVSVFKEDYRKHAGMNK